jgi:hypothetical protein
LCFLFLLLCFLFLSFCIILLSLCIISLLFLTFVFRDLLFQLLIYWWGWGCRLRLSLVLLFIFLYLFWDFFVSWSSNCSICPCGIRILCGLLSNSIRFNNSTLFRILTLDIIFTPIV